MDLVNFDTTKCLEELEAVRKATSNWSSMASKGNKLRKKALKDFTNEELRLSISQNSSLKYLVPLAIERLLKDPLAKGDIYQGDLMNAVLTVEKKFWVDDLNGYIPMLKFIIEKALSTVKANPDDYKKYMQRSAHAIKLFQENIML